MTTFKSHCSVDYHEFAGPDLETQGHKVSSGIYGHPVPFASPPFTQTVFDGLVEDVHLTYEAYHNGGVEQKGAYMTARTALIGALDTTGHFVDALPGVNDDMIVLAGFTPTKTGRTDAVVCEAPVITHVDKETTTWLKPLCNAVPGAIFYGCLILEAPLGENIVFYNGQIIISPVTGPIPVPSNVRLVVTKGRLKEIPQLEKGKDYWIYMYAGNSAGISPLSAGVQVMCN